MSTRVYSLSALNNIAGRKDDKRCIYAIARKTEDIKLKLVMNSCTHGLDEVLGILLADLDGAFDFLPRMGQGLIHIASPSGRCRYKFSN